MPLSIVGATQAVRSGSIITLPVPSVQDGDLLLVGIHLDSSSETALTAPAGWTKRNFWSLNGGHGLHIYYRIANSEPASYDWTVSAAAVAICLAIRGQDSTTPFDVADSTPAQINGSSISTNSITTQTANALLIAIACQNVGAVTGFTPPSGFTERADAAVGWAAIACATNSAATAGSYGPYTFVSAQSNNSAGWLTAIRPASSGHSLTAQSATLTPSGPSLALSQGHALALQSGSLSLSAPSAVLSQAHALGAGPGSLALEGAALALSQTLSLSVQSATLAPSAPALGLSQTHTLAFQSATLSLSSTDLAISQGGEILLALQSGTLNLSAPGTALAQTHGLAFQNGTLSVQTTNIALSQGGSHTLSIQNGTLTFSGPSVALGQSHTLTATAGVQGLQSTAVALQQSHSLALAPGSLTLSGSAIAIYSQSLQGSRFVASPLAPRYQATPERPKYLARKE